MGCNTRKTNKPVLPLLKTCVLLLERPLGYARFDVLTAVDTKNADVCEVTPCILVDIYLSSGVIFRIDSQYEYFEVSCILFVCLFVFLALQPIVVVFSQPSSGF
jgi:hypothetical protein